MVKIESNVGKKVFQSVKDQIEKNFSPKEEKTAKQSPLQESIVRGNVTVIKAKWRK